jgi:hypothetical protein
MRWCLATIVFWQSSFLLSNVLLSFFYTMNVSVCMLIAQFCSLTSYLGSRSMFRVVIVSEQRLRHAMTMMLPRRKHQLTTKIIPYSSDMRPALLQYIILSPLVRQSKVVFLVSFVIHVTKQSSQSAEVPFKRSSPDCAATWIV